MTSSPLLTDVILKYFLLLVMSSGVAFIKLGGVNLVFLQVSPKFITTFPMLPDPIPYSESESLLLRRRFRFLVSFFLSIFLSLSNFSLNCVKDCFMGLGFFPPFLAARNWIFPFRLSQNNDDREYCALCTCPHASCTGHNVSWYVPFLGLWPLLVPGRFVPFFLLCKVFLSREGLDFSDLSWPHTCSIASRD
jgi:hypothetical protein